MFQFTRTVSEQAMLAQNWQSLSINTWQDGPFYVSLQIKIDSVLDLHWPGAHHRIRTGSKW